MKIRTGFVSNSSSSSFIIKLYNITPKQIKQIINHIVVAKKMKMKDFWNDPWHIEVNENEIKGYTTVDNFDMNKFLYMIGIAENFIEWGREWEWGGEWEK